jgi:hypothetical protein
MGYEKLEEDASLEGGSMALPTSDMGLLPSEL